MTQVADDQQLLTWLVRLRAIPAPLQNLAVRCLGFRYPALAGRLRHTLAQKRKGRSLLDLPAINAHVPKPLVVNTLTALTECRGEASRADTATARINERIGPWRITGLIGSGGMGSVYEAWRDDGQYEQKVALKCIRSDLFTTEMTQAFIGERNALAKLEHKGIVPLLDGGVDQHGSPWFVMRYVEGEAIDTWCDRRRATIPDRVRLIMQACDALAFAHRRGVLHGDIKPSNLLVTPDGEVQLVDFGLSVALTGEQFAEIEGISPGYSSPESTTRAPLTTAADVYSVGAVLYRVLGGEPPASSLFSALWSEALLPSTTVDEIARLARPETAAARGLGSNRQLSKLLKGDLSAIASRCVALTPDQRYSSMDALKEDLSRWLARRPVTTRNGGLFHRFTLLVSRQRLASALVVMLAVGAITGAVILTAKSRQASEEAASNVAMSGILEQTLGNATLSALGGVPYSPDAMLDQAERQIRSLTQGKQPAVLARGLLILARSHSLAGSYTKARALVDEAGELLPDDTESGVEIQATRAALSNIAGDSLSALRTANAGLSALGSDDGTNHLLRVHLLTEAAKAQWNLGRSDEAKRSIAEAMRIAHSLGSKEAQIDLLLVRGDWNARLFVDKPAIADLRRALSLTRDSQPLLRARVQAPLATVLARQGQFDEAVAMAKSQYELTKSVLGENHPLTGLAAITLGRVTSYAGDNVTARGAFDQGLRTIASTFGANHPTYAHAVIFSQETRQSDSRGSAERASAEMRKALDTFIKFYPPGHADVLRAKLSLAAALYVQADGEADAGSDARASLLAESRRLYEDILSEFERKREPPFPPTRNMLARALILQGTPDDLAYAEKLVRESQADLSARLPPEHPLHDGTRDVLATVLYAKGNLDEADQLAARVIESSYRKLPSINAHNFLHSSLMMRAQIAAKKGDLRLANAFLDEAEAVATEAFGPDHSLVRDTLSKRADLNKRK